MQAIAESKTTWAEDENVEAAVLQQLLGDEKRYADALAVANRVQQRMPSEERLQAKLGDDHPIFASQLRGAIDQLKRLQGAR